MLPRALMRMSTWRSLAGDPPGQDGDPRGQVDGGHGDGPGRGRLRRLVHQPARGHLQRHHRAAGEGPAWRQS